MSEEKVTYRTEEPRTDEPEEVDPEEEECAAFRFCDREKLAEEDVQSCLDDRLRIVDLMRPIKDAAGEPLGQIRIREPKARAYRETDKVKGEIAKAVRLLSITAGIPEKVIDRLSGRDFGRLMEAMADLGFKTRSEESEA